MECGQPMEWSAAVKCGQALDKSEVVDCGQAVEWIVIRLVE